MYLYSLGAQERHITQWVQLWSISGHHIEWQKLHLPCAKLAKNFRYPYLNLHLELLYSKSAKMAKFIDSQAILPTTKGIQTFKKCFLSI